MLKNSEKEYLVSKILDKDKKILLSNVIDKANISAKTNKVISTDFLDLNDVNIITPYLNKQKIEYFMFRPNFFMEKSICVLGICEDDNLINVDFSKYVSCIKIVPNSKNNLNHKDYMGAIYSLGIKNEKIGDIFIFDGCGYVFCVPSVKEYILLNLMSVGREYVTTEDIGISSDEVKKLSIDFEERNIIVPSLRLDSIVASLCNFSRTKAKDKIQLGEVFVNYNEVTKADYILKETDILSIRKIGKFRIGRVENKTKSLNLVLKVFKYK